MRTTKYDNAKHPKLLVSMLRDGKFEVDFCNHVGIDIRTFDEWKDKHKDFSEAYSIGIVLAEAWWVKLGQAGAMGKIKVNNQLWLSIMKNRFGWF